MTQWYYHNHISGGVKERHGGPVSYYLVAWVTPSPSPSQYQWYNGRTTTSASLGYYVISLVMFGMKIRNTDKSVFTCMLKDPPCVRSGCLRKTKGHLRCLLMQSIFALQDLLQRCRCMCLSRTRPFFNSDFIFMMEDWIQCQGHKTWWPKLDWTAVLVFGIQYKLGLLACGFHVHAFHYTHQVFKLIYYIKDCTNLLKYLYDTQGRHLESMIMFVGAFRDEYKCQGRIHTYLDQDEL